MKLKDETGNTYGYLTVIERAPSKDGRTQWLCKCKCGNTTVVIGKLLRNGDTKSCGCIKSLGEAEIQQWLETNNYNFKTQYSFKDFYKVNTAPYKFDFGILDDNNELLFLIEYQGNIHFEIGSGWNNEDVLRDCQERDTIKEKYCKDKKIMLYYITYKENIENRLKEIFNEQFGTNY